MNSVVEEGDAQRSVCVGGGVYEGSEVAEVGDYGREQEF